MGDNFVRHFRFALELVFLFVLKLSFAEGTGGSFAEGRATGTKNRSTDQGRGNFGDALQYGQGFLEKLSKRKLFSGFVLVFILIFEFVLAFAEQSDRKSVV